MYVGNHLTTGNIERAVFAHGLKEFQCKPAQAQKGQGK